MGLLEIVQIRDAVNGVCAAIDTGEVVADEDALYALAVLARKHGGPLAYELVCKLAARSPSGRLALKDMAQ